MDVAPVDGVTDLVVDLDGPALADHLAPDSVDESLGLHVLEHLHHPLAFMEALWVVTKPGGTVTFEVPYGASDDAWEDPTHTRPYYLNSWPYFGQPNYFRADYGYRGDWRVVDVTLAVPQKWRGADPDEILGHVQRERNVVRAMRATLEAVKPARPQDVELREQIAVKFALVAA